MKQKITQFFENEKILLISAAIALLTIIFVPVDYYYLEYINLSVLCLLFSLMAVIAGLTACNAFQWLAASLLKISKNGRILSIILIMLPFFSAMLLTNDVALITFVPFTILLLKQIDCKQAVIPILVIQTIAANLGSMATPIGNPQNLFLYEKYQISAMEFFKTMFPLSFLSFLGLLVASLFLLPKELPTILIQDTKLSLKRLFLYIGLFFLCLLTVFRVLPYAVVTITVFLVLLVFDHNLLKQLDYALLLTFVCFFIISGNLGRIEAIQNFLEYLLRQNTLLTGVAASQFISNVPTAVLLSTFTDIWQSLLISVNIGGLGTPIASLASLITLKLYTATPDANARQFLKIFMMVNVIALATLLLFSYYLV